MFHNIFLLQVVLVIRGLCIFGFDYLRTRKQGKTEGKSQSEPMFWYFWFLHIPINLTQPTQISRETYLIVLTYVVQKICRKFSVWKQLRLNLFLVFEYRFITFITFFSPKLTNFVIKYFWCFYCCLQFHFWTINYLHLLQTFLSV